MMLAVVSGSFAAKPAMAAAPEALDPEFLDYLLACEGKDDNWTVVADPKLRKKASKTPAKEKSTAPAKETREEAKP
jgi:hypothetical protein